MSALTPPVSRRHPAPSTDRVTGWAALGYGVGVGVENLDVLGAPRLGSPVGEIRAAYIDTGPAVLGTVSGGLALACFVVVAVGLHRRLFTGGGWTQAGLVGGIAGPALAAAGLGVEAALAGGAGHLPDAAVLGLFETRHRLALVAGPAVALFLLGLGSAARRAGGLPRELARSAQVLGAPLLLVPLVLLDPGGAGQSAVVVGFGLFTLWVFGTGL